MKKNDDVKCSFCGCNSAEVERILAGPQVAICDGCVSLAVEFVGKGRSAWCKDLIEKLKVLKHEDK